MRRSGLVLVFFFTLTIALSSYSDQTWLFQRDGKLYSETGEEVRLTGVNWFGFETSNKVLHGLWSRDYKGVIRQVASLGFNCLRIPWSNAILEEGAQAQSITFYGSDPFRPDVQMNSELEGKGPVEILDSVISACSELGLKVILDNHSREPDGYMQEKLWYTDNVSHEKWIEDWLFFAKRYKGNKTVIGFDLNNEPHGKDGEYSRWGSNDPATDWKMAAQECGNAVLEINPDVLIIVEGVERAGDDLYWWGGNLTGVRDSPVELSDPEKLVYSPHEYGPEVFQQEWFTSEDFPQNIDSIWEDKFGYIFEDRIGHLLIGEFGIKDRTAFDGVAETWFDSFMEYMGGRYSWTYWSLNPNSGDTGGILEYDWTTVVDWKMEKLSPYMAPMIDGPGGQVNSRRRLGAHGGTETVAGYSKNRYYSLNGREIKFDKNVQNRNSLIIMIDKNGRHMMINPLSDDIPLLSR